MKVQAIRSTAVTGAGRLDAGYHLAPGQLAAARLAKARAVGVRCPKLGEPEGIAKVWSPNRFKRAYAAVGEESVPYLRPYDVFYYLPEPADLLSAARTEKLDDYRLKRGMILQTCSGRNLGPAVMTDAWLARFVLSHDMIRVEIDDERMRFYVLAFLQSEAGQNLLRRDMTGSVIDHLSDRHVADQEVPVFEDIIADVSATMAEAVRLRASARLMLAGMIEELQRRLPPLTRTAPRRDGWTARSAALGRSGRIDAAFHDPLVAEVRRGLLEIGGVRVGDVATVLLPGRFKRQYTVSETHGRPMVSGTQLLQAKPINLQHILPQSFRDVANYTLRTGWIAYTADGRAEEGLGTPSFITSDRDGWLASNHVGRVVPNDGIDAGWLYLALRANHTLTQIKSMASGSVVDATYPSDMEAVIIPPSRLVDGAKVTEVWDRFRQANELECRAVRRVDVALAAVGGSSSSSLVVPAPSAKVRSG
jgi:hypothetical protein